MSDQAEILKRILVAVLPGIAVTLAVCLLMLGVGVVIVTEGHRWCDRSPAACRSPGACWCCWRRLRPD
jgi:hypothetical protein